MKASQQNLVSGIGSNTFKASIAGVHTVTTTTTCQRPSSLVITIAQSGSTSVTVTSPTTAPAQKHIELNGKFNLAVGDVITVTTASSAVADQPPADIKTTINIKQGI